MNFLTKIKAFFTNLFGGKTEFNLEIKVEEGDVSAPNTEEVLETQPIIDMAPECDEHVPSKTIVLKEAPPETFFRVEDAKIESVKEIKSKSRTKKEKEESQPKETKEKKSKKKS